MKPAIRFSFSRCLGLRLLAFLFASLVFFLGLNTAHGVQAVKTDPAGKAIGTNSGGGGGLPSDVRAVILTCKSATPGSVEVNEWRKRTSQRGQRLIEAGLVGEVKQSAWANEASELRFALTCFELAPNVEAKAIYRLWDEASIATGACSEAEVVTGSFQDCSSYP